MVASNLFPVLTIIPLFRCHIFFVFVWLSGVIMGTQTHHCGYRAPWIAYADHQPDYHDLHHQIFNCNYGNVGLLDYLHGTTVEPAEYHAAKAAKAAERAAAKSQ